MSASKSPLRKLLGRFNLGDEYEIQARVLPAMIVMMPVAILVAQVELQRGSGMAAIGWGAGLEIVLAILLSKAGHALGVDFQATLEKRWGGLPTHSWLHPSDGTHSEQQKKVWRKAVSTVSGLNIDKSIKDNPADAKKIIADAVTSCRNKIRGNRKAALVQKQNITFGFARNYGGMRWLALATCVLCFSASLYGTIYKNFEVGGTLLQALFLMVAIVNCVTAHAYVKHCSIRYAEFFFGAVTEIADA